MRLIGHSVASGSAGDVDGVTTTDPSFWRDAVHLRGCRRAGGIGRTFCIDADERSVVVRITSGSDFRDAPHLAGMFVRRGFV